MQLWDFPNQRGAGALHCKTSKVQRMAINIACINLNFAMQILSATQKIFDACSVSSDKCATGSTNVWCAVCSVQCVA